MSRKERWKFPFVQEAFNWIRKECNFDFYLLIVEEGKFRQVEGVNTDMKLAFDLSGYFDSAY